MSSDLQQSVETFLHEAELSWSWAGFSALDRYYRGRTRATSYGNAPELNPHELILIRTDMSTLAAGGFSMSFPGIEGIDCVLTLDGSAHDLFVMLYDSKAERDAKLRRFFGADNTRLELLESRRSPSEFRLRPGVYQRMRDRSYIADIGNPAEGNGSLLTILSEAVLLSRYRTGDYARAPDSMISDALNCRFDSYDEGDEAEPRWDSPGLPPAQWRYWLDLILTGASAHLGLEYLMCAGVIEHIAPELSAMNRTHHHKDHHPEGNVWRHSLETLKYRKTTDLLLAYSLLLHDAGKPEATRESSRRFSGHAQIGADLAGRLLDDLEYPRRFRDDVCWMVENHSYPSALRRLPSHRTDPLMADPRFPDLLELYRCDISASYSGPENYYAACDVYNRYRKDMGLRRYRPVG